ncbi:MAG TPA: SDR family NAD(P)-dependent oxidoreductase [Actinomycetota bacterium]|nr:SDR family NAD(P)-dependent oxidoreductase [Actinomycetota bacterium]
MPELALVTGGAGFIGSHVVEELVAEGLQVRVLDTLVKGKLASIQYLVDNGKVEFVEGDIRDRDSVDKAVRGCDYVFHTAGIHIVRSFASPEECIDVNIRGSYNVFRAALTHGVRRVVFSSSSSIYGDPERLPMSEDSPVNATDPYGASKWMAEQLLVTLAGEGLEWNALRYFNVYGERQAAHAYYTTVITTFIKRLLNGEPPVIDGKGEQSMDFTHVSDVARANLLAMRCEAHDEVFNVGTGVSTTVKELAEILRQALGVDVVPQFSGRATLVQRRQADTRKAEELMGFIAKTDVRTGLTDVAKAIAAQPHLY